MAESRVEAKVDSEIVRMWRTDGRLYAIGGFLLGVMALPLLGSLDGGRLAAFLQELAPEAVGILVTVIVIDRMNRRRDERNAEAALKQRLIEDAASYVNDIANNAVYQMSRKGWLRGERGLLRGADLAGANLQAANLFEANLQAANLFWANLQGADLAGANLQAADLREAKLQGAALTGAKLEGTNLHGATLHGANLSGAKLQAADLRKANLQAAQLAEANLQAAQLAEANLQGAELWGANLQEADLSGAKFYESTILPDETQWTPETDMHRFTDPEHPDFWRSDYEHSPAYRGKGAVG
jgi:hypothetical protein